IYAAALGFVGSCFSLPAFKPSLASSSCGGHGARLMILCVKIWGEWSKICLRCEFHRFHGLQERPILHRKLGRGPLRSEFHTQAPASEAWHLVEAAAGEFRLPDTP